MSEADSVASPDGAPRVSITVLNYNYAGYIAGCLESILDQTYTDLEVIVVNDASTDDSLEVIEPFLADPRVRLIDHQDNRGFRDSLIEGSEASESDYLAVVSADDWFVDATAVELMVDALDADDDCVLAFGSYGHYYDPAERSHLSRFGDDSWTRDGSDAFATFIDIGIPLHTGSLIRRSAYREIGGYDRELRYALDIQIFYGLCQVGTVAYIDRESAAWRRHAESMTKDLTGVGITIREVLDIIDWSFGLMDPATREQHADLRTKARKNALTMFANDAVFSGDTRLAGRHMRLAIGISPSEALLQRTTAVMAARAVAGERGWAQIERLKERRGR